MILLSISAVSPLGCSRLVFVNPGVKIIGAYYRDVLLAQHLLPVIPSNVYGCVGGMKYGSMKTKCERPSVEAATNTIKDLLKFAIVRNSHFKHLYLFIH